MSCYLGTYKLTLLTQAGSRFEFLMLFLFEESFLTIDISGFGLDTVAPISKYQHLQRLKLAKNKLSTLNSLGNLNNVVYIDASDNELTGKRTTRPFRDNGIGRHD